MEQNSNKSKKTEYIRFLIKAKRLIWENDKNCLIKYSENYVDILEIDGASNNGVDEIRTKIDGVNLIKMANKFTNQLNYHYETYVNILLLKVSMTFDYVSKFFKHPQNFYDPYFVNLDNFLRT